jgi:hypothetical protein
MLFDRDTLTYGIVGILAALVVISATGARVILPRLEEGGLSLGFLGRLIVGAATAWAWDNNPIHAFLASLVAVGAVSQWDRIKRVVSVQRTPATENERIRIVRHKLQVAEQNAAYFGAGEVPVHLTLFIEEAKKELHELEQLGESMASR